MNPRLGIGSERLPGIPEQFCEHGGVCGEVRHPGSDDAAAPQAQACGKGGIEHLDLPVVVPHVQRNGQEIEDAGDVVPVRLQLAGPGRDRVRQVPFPVLQGQRRVLFLDEPQPQLPAVVQRHAKRGQHHHQDPAGPCEQPHPSLPVAGWRRCD